MSDREAGAAPGPWVVLCLVVKNEEKIIARCLRSALPHVDAVVVCFNGRTETVERIQAALENEKWPQIGTGRFHCEEQPWVNFAHNRTLSAETAKRWVKERHPEWVLEQTYLLFLDADMELVVEPDFRKTMLTAPGYRLLQRNHGEHYENLRLARLDRDWRAVGVTHEYWAPTPDFGEPPSLPRTLMWIQDHDDGGSKSDKTPRDIALLEQGLIDEPGNGRYMFYLARAYADSGQHEKAITLYRKRREVGGWDQEVWYAHYREGLSLLALGKEAEGVGTLIAAYQSRPTRAEPLASLAQHYRERGRNHAALMFARQARKIPTPSDALFVWADAHRALPLREIAITAYYAGTHEEGRLAAEALLSRRDEDGSHQHMLQTVSFYMQPLLPLAIRSGKFDVSYALRTESGRFFGLTETSSIEYLSSSPTLVEYRGVTYVNVRLVNYYHERGRVFAPKDADGVVRTRNAILKWDPKSDIVRSEVESQVTLPADWDHQTRVRGLEDQRWVVHDDRIWLTFTCFNIPGAGGMPRVALARVNEDVTGIDHVVALDYAGTGKYEKNWLIWPLREKEMLLIYGYDPFVVLRVDPMSGACTIASVKTPPMHTAAWRGSCAPVRFRPGHWLGMIHETAWFENHTVYMHRWVEFSDDMEITRASGLFTFEHSGVEYALGLLECPEPPTMDHLARPTFIVTYSLEERASRWAEFDYDTINRALGAPS